jgi:signal transduction histidine kinase
LPQLDRKSRALRPRARILRTLGEELISSEIVAILELVKNAYDADARFVLVEFFDSLEAGKGGVDVNDDGHGMSLATVQGAWMEPATSVKKYAKQSKYLHRRLLGEKGIGRFAAARLAGELELITRPPASALETYAIFDWSQFDSDEKYLDEVLVLAEERQPEVLVAGRKQPIVTQAAGSDELPRDGSHGTILRMNKLKVSWSADQLDALRRGLSRLVSPFDEDRFFRIFLRTPGETESARQEVSAPAVLKYPHYEINGKVKDSGEFELKIAVHSVSKLPQIILGKFVHNVDQGNEVTAVEIGDESTLGNSISCGPFDFKILVWDRDELESLNQKLGGGIKSIRQDLDAIAGISIYRDGFRVLPYGEPENDWLRLDSRRVQNPSLRLSNNQLTGFIRIGADANPELRDQSNREGLNDNLAYSELQAVILLALAELESLRFDARKKERTPQVGSAESLLGAPDISGVRKKLSKLKANAATIRLFDETAKRWERQVVRVREVLSRYHSLATLGQLIDKVVHDSRQPLSTIESQSALAREVIANWLEDNSKSSACGQILTGLDRRLQKVHDGAILMDAVLNRIEPLGGKRRGRASKLYVEEIIKHAFSYFEADLKSLGVRLTLPKEVNLAALNGSELEQVLINLISNSLYWLAKVPKERRAIIVACSRPTPGKIEIIFADSGPGVPLKYRDSIFEPYFSTKPNGVGLGLVIAGEIVRDFYNGSLELLNSGPLKGAVFRIVLQPRA